MSDDPPDDGMWFRPKRYGYGSGLPIAGQGWALLGGFIAASMTVGPLLASGSVPVKFAAIAGFGAMTIAFCLIVRRRTRGGWRSRWGEDD